MSDSLGAKIAENRDAERPPHGTSPERTRRPVAPGSLGFAATAAGLFLVVSLGLGLGMIHVPRWFEDPPPAAPTAEAGPYDVTPTGTTSSWTTTGRPTTTRSTSSGTPVGYFRYTGPEGLTTVLPDSYAVVDGSGAGVVTARNQLDPDVEVRFGGAPPEGYDGLYDTIAAAAESNAGLKDYRQHALERAWHGGLDAVDWEFQYQTEEGQTRRVRAHYWRTGGIEYVLLATAPTGRWSEARQLLDTMIDHSDTP
ncbi:hypothetical protein [Saccharothrix texasensis]|uniref:Uncharacterized protein n=1 Tax=Saccharothrix texasensis TaxID=103734 RepID=A0A3N1H6X6_9PSEU|nr:hypothetical protein [Saccharothrix texasensis]ROP38283.1 hypothetical protein EDD40_3636 [Saccharothrix texasensis]